jgi:hypothetical protein
VRGILVGHLTPSCRLGDNGGIWNHFTEGLAGTGFITRFPTFRPFSSWLVFGSTSS